jgi:hypothetical protein
VNGILDEHTHNVITIEIASDLGELAEILGDVSLQTKIMPLLYG